MGVGHGISVGDSISGGDGIMLRTHVRIVHPCLISMSNIVNRFTCSVFDDDEKQRARTRKHTHTHTHTHTRRFGEDGPRQTTRRVAVSSVWRIDFSRRERKAGQVGMDASMPHVAYQDCSMPRVPYWDARIAVCHAWRVAYCNPSMPRARDAWLRSCPPEGGAGGHGC